MRLKHATFKPPADNCVSRTSAFEPVPAPPCLRYTGYEISFTRYFYKPAPLRTLEEIRADILARERETEGLLSEITQGAVM